MLLKIRGRWTPTPKPRSVRRRKALVHLVEGEGGRVNGFEMALGSEVDTSKGEEAKEELQTLLR